MIEVKHLSIDLKNQRTYRPLIQDLSFELRPKESLALVGESGCGKSLTALALLGLLQKPQLRLSKGQIIIDGVDFLTASPAVKNQIRGGVVSMIFQEPMSALNPIYTVGAMIHDVLRKHLPKLSFKQRQSRIDELFEKMRIPTSRMRAYPHELSGGMRQRAMIAMALASGPRYLIADEPTTALDVTTQAQVLEEIAQLKKDFELGVIFISHDLGLVAEYTDKMMVMYCGRIVESGISQDVLKNPQHPYTLGLLKSIPSLTAAAQKRLPTMAGRVPASWNFAQSCVFADRCPKVQARCEKEEPIFTANAGVACFYPEAIK
jgi:oligopeptide/dipeptide ABC transporter ATP-binding protein